MDTIYYALNIASQTGARLTAGDGTPALAATPFYVSGEESRRLAVSREMRRFADEVIAIQPTAEFNRHVIAGTPATQPSAVDDILAALDRLADKGLNLQKATPASWSLAGAGTLAAYQVTLNALEIEETD